MAELAGTKLLGMMLLEVGPQSLVSLLSGVALRVEFGVILGELGLELGFGPKSSHMLQLNQLEWPHHNIPVRYKAQSLVSQQDLKNCQLQQDLGSQD